MFRPHLKKQTCTSICGAPLQSRMESIDFPGTVDHSAFDDDNMPGIPDESDEGDHPDTNAASARQQRVALDSSSSDGGQGDEDMSDGSSSDDEGAPWAVPNHGAPTPTLVKSPPSNPAPG